MLQYPDDTADLLHSKTLQGFTAGLRCTREITLTSGLALQPKPKTRRPLLGGSRRRETAQRPEIRASTALGGTRRSAACAQEFL